MKHFVVGMSQTLGWQPLAGRVAMQRCAASNIWLHERITLARYAHVHIFLLNTPKQLINL
jgi:hypothetical protein